MTAEDQANALLLGQTQPGNITNLGRRPTFVRAPDGARMTVYSLGFRDRNGDEVLIPQVIDGQLLGSDQAIEHYYRSGEHLGKFEPTQRGIDASDEMGRLVHEYEQMAPGIRALLQGLRF